MKKAGITTIILATLLLAYLFNIVLTVLTNDYFALHGQAVNEQTRVLFFLMNLGICSIIVFAFATYFVNAALAERDRANGLLLNILPLPIAERLKLRESPISDKFESVTVLFSDILPALTKYRRYRQWTGPVRT